MMASSPSSRAVLTRQRNNNTRVYVTIITIILLDLSISVQSIIFGVHESLTARVGDTVNMHFEYCGRPRPVCTLTQSFNLSAPNPTCIVDRYGHCEVVPAPDDDGLREHLDIGCELCVLVVRGVTQRDAGRYAICQLPGACTSSFWSNIATLEVVSGNEDLPMPTNCTSTEACTQPTTGIHGVDIKMTARVGDTINIYFKYCGLPRPSCTLTHSFKLSAPNPSCTVVRHGHCEVARAPDDDPLRHDFDKGCELCVLVVYEVTKRDAGPYAICQTSGACTGSFWRKISTLEVVSGNEEPPMTMPTSMSTKVYTKPTTEKKETAPLTNKAVEPYPILSTTYTEEVGSNDHHLNEKHEHPGKSCTTRNIILTVVSVFIALVALIIWAIRWVRKRRNRSKSHDHECYDHECYDHECYDHEGPPMGYPQPVAT